MDRAVIATAYELFEARHYPSVIALISDALEDEPEHVGEIVPGIRKQRHRIGEKAEHDLGSNKGDVEQYPERERARVIRLVMVMRMSVLRHERAPSRPPLRNSNGRSTEDH